MHSYRVNSQIAFNYLDMMTSKQHLISGVWIFTKRLSLLSEPASAEKQRIAEEVASMLKLSVDLDTSSTESLQKVVVTLRAGAEYAEVPLCNCVLVAGSQTGVVAAERIGMPCVVLRSSLTARAEFPSAKAVMDGFGGADLSVSKLKQKRWS